MAKVPRKISILTELLKFFGYCVLLTPRCVYGAPDTEPDSVPIIHPQTLGDTSNPFHRRTQLPAWQAQRIHIHLDFPATSMVVRAPADIALEQMSILAHGDTFTLEAALHGGRPGDTLRRSRLVIFPQAVQQLYMIASDSVRRSLLCDWFYAPRLPDPEAPKPRAAPQKSGPEPPSFIPQSQWRRGLPAPRPDPQSTSVRHIILHHSAGSNSDTNYTQTVRNIYLYHTQGRGWDDIGYNYLIAANGWVFEGRDGQGRLADHDVKGAHYCGKNSYTMGICMLGHFGSAYPSFPAATAAVALMSWKLDLEDLHPQEQAIHPPNRGAWLPRIAGHRDGCATACPGQRLYQELPDLRLQAARRMGVPAGSAPQSPVPDTGHWIICRGATWRIQPDAPRILRATLIDLQGKPLERWTLPRAGQDYAMMHHPSGIYLLQLHTSHQVYSERILLR